ncbi:MAG: translocation/assembly module TamB domain-containing protein, partial [Cyanobacteria bacterium P01_G01_bin.49]
RGVLSINQGKVVVDSETKAGKLVTSAAVLNLPINSFFPQIPVPVTLINSNINLEGNLRSLLMSSTRLNLNALQMKADTQLAIANQTITASSQLNQGVVNLNIKQTPLTLSPIILKGYPPITVKEIQANLTSNLSSLLTLDFSSIKGYTETELAVAQGNVIIFNKIIDNKIQANITTKNIDLSSLNNQLLTNLNLETLEGNIIASIPLNSILPSSLSLPIQVSQLFFQVGEQTLKADGSILVSNLWQNPDVKNVSLNVESSFNLETLSLTSLLTKVPIKREYLPEKLLLTGIGEFTGQFNGKNLLTSPLFPGNIKLIGDIKVSELSFNDRNFESTLTGNVDFDSLEKFSLNLQGKQDIIQAIFTPCLSENCFFPYVVQSFKIRQNDKTSSPILVQGNRQNDNLVAKVENLPLDILKINPLGNYGLPDYLQGNLNIELDFNPINSNFIGRITILSPQLGKVIGDQLAVILSYKNHELTLKQTRLNIGESNYNISGKINFLSGEIESKVNVNDGHIEDIVTALQISNWDSLLRLLQSKNPNITTAEKVAPTSIGTSQQSVKQQLHKLWEISNLIRENFAEVQAGDLPKQLDFRGQFQAEVSLGGTIQNPQVSLQFEGNKWQWNTQPSTASIVDPLGLVMEGSQVIPIEKLAIKGKLNKDEMNLNSTINVAETIIDGKLNLTYQDSDFYINSSQFQIKNLTLDVVRNLIIIPSDANGIINLEGIVNGPLNSPEVNGVFEFSDVAINARFLNQDLGGQFVYTENKLKVNTTKPDFVQVFASLPFPIKADQNDRFEIKAKIGTQAFSLLQPLTLDQIIWINGEGEILIDISGRLSINNQIKVALDPESQINLTLSNATVTNNFLQAPLILNGKIDLKNRAINIANFAAKLGERNLNLTGSLPLLPSSDDEESTQKLLTARLTQDQINQSGIYQGLVRGNILVSGSLINPIIGGEINLSEGVFKVPNINLSSENKSTIFEKWLGTLASEKNVVIPPKLNNFKLIFEELSIERTSINPQAFLNVSGDITLNGQIDNLSLAELLSIEPSGKIRVNSGKVNIPVTRVFVNRQHENTITFFPDQGLLNPTIDLELNLYLFALALQSIKDNEIIDDIVQSGRAKSVEVTLKIQGSANEVLPNFTQQLEQVCQLRSPDTPPISPIPEISSQQLKKLANCIEVNNLGTNSIQELLRSPIVSFSSNPPLSNTELLTLFNTQVPDFIDQLQNQNSSQLVEAGILQSVVVALPFLQDLVFESNEKTSEVGKQLGLTNLRFFPVLETVYELEESGLIRFSYDYTLNEATIRYETKF